ncbi:MAG: hydrogenase small subunit [Gemmatimonadota bacterium]|jgi:hydrogenase small subunit
MYFPMKHAWTGDETLGEHLEREGVDRRDFLKFCGQISVMLGLGQAFAPKVAAALQAVRRPSVVWLSLQECTGCTESVLRTADPTIGDLVLDLISLDFQENLMAAAGDAAENALHAAMDENSGEYILVVTGSVPTEGDEYLMIAGRPGREILEEAAENAAAIFAVGACAHFGSVQSANPNPTGAVGVSGVVRDKPIVTIAGCPPIADVVTATIVHYLTFGRLPETDGEGRPLFAYGARIHDQCQRRAHFDAGQFAHSFDDEGARQGWCLYEVGCKGPATFSPCPIFQWNDHTDWPIGAGHPCLGCTERFFWDTMTPFYSRLPDVAGFGVERSADLLGAALAVGATAGVAAHAVATGISRARHKNVTPLPVVAGPGSGPAKPSNPKEDSDA